MFDDFDDLPGTNEGPGNAKNDRWNIVGNSITVQFS
jgi:hypothetical protein